MPHHSSEELRMKRILFIAVLAVLALSGAIPGAAQARACAIGDIGVTRNRNGVAAKFENLDARQGMNCFQHTTS
jgi:hypothetical protein